MHRTFSLWTICLVALLLMSSRAFGQGLDFDPALQPFYHGVASGDPLPDRVIIWTRVTPEESSPEDVDVIWKVATDSAMRNVMQSGLFTTNADRDYTVKVDVTDLTPYHTYYYQFEALDATSIVGRTRTAPTADEADQLRFAVISCSNYQAGYFSAYKKVAERADLDAVIHLGDYIYEYSATGEDFYGNADLRDAGKRRHLPDKEIVSLEDYRTRYSQYRLDSDLRAAHQQHPFITIWDDHESANDAYKDGAENHQPELEGPWSVRKSVSRQAYNEWLPIRVNVQEQPLYRTIQYGNLVDLIMLDTRLEERVIQKMSVTDPELYSPKRTILGAEQKQWFYDQLQNSKAKWKVVGNQVILSPFNVWFAGLDPNGNFTTQSIESVFLDIWDGYPAERDEVINFVGDNNIENVVILTGDFHSSFAYDVTTQPSPLSGSDPSIATTGQVPVPVTPTYDPETRSGSVAVEFATPSINSANFDENIGKDATLGFEAQINAPLPVTIPGVGGVNPNPHMQYNDLDEHGYFILDVAEGRAQANWYYVNTILEPNSDEYFAAAWGTNDGDNFLTEGEEDTPKDFPQGSDGDEMFTLQLLHGSDLEGGVDAIDNAPNFAAIVDKLEDSYEATVRISAGDNYIPGPFFNAAADGSLRPVLQNVYQELLDEPGLTNLRETAGRVDISIMNVMGFDASALGNHELDAGPDALADIIGTDIRGETLGDVRWLGARFPYLSANLDFSAEESLTDLYTDALLPSTAFISSPDNLAEAADAPKIAPATFIETGGERIGVVGATTQVLASITSEGDITVVGPNENDMPALAEILQPQINRLRNQGINKIIVVSHLQQIALEQQLVGLLSGVDIVIAGGSDVLLAQDDDVLFPGEMFVDTYPLITQNADGETAAIVGTPGEYTYVGRLIAEFDGRGVLVASSLDNPENGAYAALPTVVDQLWEDEDAFAEGTKAELVSRLTEAVREVVATQDGNIFGRTAVYLEGRREQVRTEETNLGNLTADANLATARQVDPDVQVSIKNGGGIRAAIGEIIDLGGGEAELAPPQANPVTGKEEGEVSQLDIVNALRFNNGLTLLTLSTADLKQVLEHAVSATEPGATPGQFPQVGGVKFSFDTTAEEGNCIQFVALTDEESDATDTLVVDGEIVGDAERMIRIVTLNFLADGGDNYPFPDLGENRVDLTEATLPEGEATFASTGSEQGALAEYLAANFAETPFDREETSPANDMRIINLNATDEEGATIVDIAQSDPQFSLLVEAVIKAGLAETLASAGPFTVFAPTNQAFEALFRKLGVSGLDEVPTDQLTEILLYHVIAGTLLSEDLQPGDLLETQLGASLLIGENFKGELTVNDVPIVLPDVVASNGVIHAINHVLLPVNRIRQFVLVDPATDMDMGLLMDGDTIDLSTLPEGFTGRAIVEGPVSSVEFALVLDDGTSDTLTRVENVPVYSLFPQQGSDYLGNDPAPGTYRLTITPYTMDNAEGMSGMSLTLTFVVVDKQEVPLKTIMEIAQETDDLSILVQALERADLVKTLNSEGPFTVFAPTNQAFEDILHLLQLSSVKQLPRFLLRGLLLLHVADGELNNSDLAARSEVESLLGLPLYIEGDSARLYINNAQVIAPNIQASNGIVHIVDAVILPDLSGFLASSEEGRLSTLGKSLLTTDEPLAMELKVTASPNPGTDEVTIQTKGLAGEILSVQIVDTQGRLITREQYPVSGPQDAVRLDMRQYAEGVYIINAQAGELYQYVRVLR